MSPSPSDALTVAPDYVAGWRALNRKLRAGESWSGREPDSLFLNPADGGRFFDGSTALGFESKGDGRALVPLDWDGDGDLDLAVTARTGPRFRLLRNDILRAPRAVEFVLERLDAATVGARFVVETSGGRELVRVVRAGEGYLSQDAARVFVGLGDERIVRAHVTWPGGKPVELTGLDGPGRYALASGAETLRRIDVAPVAELQPGALAATPSIAPMQLAAPVRLPRLTMRSKAGVAGDLFGVRTNGAEEADAGVGRPVLLLLFATWCEPCLQELARLARDPELFDGSTLVIALSLDEPAAEADAFRFLEEIDWPGRGAVATGETPEVLEALFGALGDRRDALALPAALVVDREGRAVALRRGAWHGAVRAPELDAYARRAAAAHEPGVWFRASDDLPQAMFEERVRELDAPLAARELSYTRIEVGAFDREQFVARGLALGQAGDLDGAIKAFESALILDPADAAAQRNLAVALDRANRPSAARAAYRRAVELDPEDAASWLQLARLLVEADDPAWRGALESLQRIASPHALDLRRWVRAKRAGD